ncbi:MAG: hypothetical protein ACR2PS_01540 [Pseudomonadales bacterium]
MRVDPNRIAELHNTYPNAEDAVDGSVLKPGFDYFSSIIQDNLLLHADALATALVAENIADLESTLQRVLSGTTAQANTPMLQFVLPLRVEIQQGMKKHTAQNAWESTLNSSLIESEMYQVGSSMKVNLWFNYYALAAVFVLVLIQLSKSRPSWGISEDTDMHSCNRAQGPEKPAPLPSDVAPTKRSVDVIKNKRRVAIDE